MRIARIEHHDLTFARRKSEGLRTFDFCIGERIILRDLTVAAALPSPRAVVNDCMSARTFGHFGVKVPCQLRDAFGNGELRCLIRSEIRVQG